MAYPGVFYSDDGQILRAMQTANEVGGDDHDARRERHRHRRAGAAGARPRRDRPEVPRLTAAAAARGRGDAPGDRARPRSPATCRSTSSTCRRRQSPGGGRRGPRRRAQRVRRDLPAVPLPRRWRTTLAQPGFEGAKWVCSPPICAPQARRHHQADLWKGLRTNDARRRLHRPLPLLLQGPEGAAASATSPRSPTASAGVEHRHGAALPGRRQRRAHPRALGRDVLPPRRPGMFGMYPKKGIIAPAPTPTSWSWDPNGQTDDRRCSGKAPHEHRPLGVGGLRDRRQGRHGARPAALVVVENDTFTGRKGHGQFVKRGLSQYLV